MKTYTFSEARQQLSSILDEASRDGEVQIRRRDGGLFVVQPVREQRSPLDVPAIKTDITTQEILEAVRDSRRRAR